MELGRVVGQVVSTVREAAIPSGSLLLIDLIDADGTVKGGGHVAIDSLGAGEGEVVLLVRGSSAQLISEKRPAVDLCVVGIVDQMSAAGEILYSK